MGSGSDSELITQYPELERGEFVSHLVGQAIAGVNAQQLLSDSWQNFLAILSAPQHHFEMVWISVPVIATLLVLTFYFGRLAKEELGWNTAIGNAVVLFIVAIDLVRQAYHYTYPPALSNLIINTAQLVAVLVVVVEAVVLLFISFLHPTPRKLFYLLSNPLPVNIQAYMAVAVVYSQAASAWETLGGALIFFAIFLCGLWLLQWIERSWIAAIKHLHVSEAKREHERFRHMLHDEERFRSHMLKEHDEALAELSAKVGRPSENK